MEILIVFAMIFVSWTALDFAADFFVAWRAARAGSRDAARAEALADLADTWHAVGADRADTYRR